jgi:hypothetical protein
VRFVRVAGSSPARRIPLFALVPARQTKPPDIVRGQRARAANQHFNFYGRGGRI